MSIGNRHGGGPRMRSGLRNRYRNGRGSYSRRRKSLVADFYGTWKDGKRSAGEKIARAG